MDSLQVFRRDRVILNQWTRRNDRYFKWFSKTSFVRSVSIRQEILNVSQIGWAFHGICHQFSSRLDCNNTAEVLPLLCAVLYRQCYLFLICVVLTYNDSRKDLHRLCQVPRKNCQCKMTLGFLSGSKNFCMLLCVSWEVFVLHGYDWIHWVAKSCTTIAYRWLFRDSQLSLRTLWSAVIKSPKFSSRGTTPPMRLLHGALVILSSGRSRSVGLEGSEYKHWVYPSPHFSWALKIIHEMNSRVSLCVQELCHPRDFLGILAAIPVYQNTTGRPVLYRGFRFIWFSVFWMDFGWLG